MRLNEGNRVPDADQQEQQAQQGSATLSGQNGHNDQKALTAEKSTFIQAATSGKRRYHLGGASAFSDEVGS